jgi:TPR repeat protein
VRTGPAADTFVEEAVGYRDVNHGDDTYLNLGTNSYPNANRTYLLFDVEPGLAAERILAAHLHLNLAYFPYGSAVDDADLYLVADPSWTEDGLTALTEPPAGSLSLVGPHRFTDLSPMVHALDVTEEIRALAAFRRACAAGLREGCVELGILGREPDPESRPVPEERAESVRAGLASCTETPDADRCLERLALFLEGTYAFSAEEVEPVLRSSCDLGQQVACLGLAWVLERMDRCEEAEAPLQRACEAAVPGACAALGSFLFAMERAEEALPLLRAACGAGEAAGCSALASLLYGDGRLEDAFAAYEKACAGDDVLACLVAADVLDELGRPEDAAALLVRACERGALDACEATPGDAAADPFVDLAGRGRTTAPTPPGRPAGP